MSLGDTSVFVGYARVSIDQRSTDAQIDSLKTAGRERVFTESMSGTRADRPQLAEALAFMRDGDVLVVVRLEAGAIHAPFADDHGHLQAGESVLGRCTRTSTPPPPAAAADITVNLLLLMHPGG
jgi:hypothetical protein